MKRYLYYVVFALLFFVIPTKVLAAAKFYLSPSSGNYKAGDTITASVMIDSGGTAVNAAEGSVTFSTDTLQYQSVSTTGSIFTFWTSGPAGSDSSVIFGGGLSNPGYNGSGGKVLTITWKAKANGTGNVTINGTKILANDGAGTNIYGSSSGAAFTIGGAKAPARQATAPTVKSSTHPDSNKWYNNKNVALSWSFSGATGYVFTFDQSPTTEAKGKAVKTTSKTQENVTDGVWYFHVKAQKAEGGFTDTTHFKVQVDTVAPEEFTVTVNQDGGSTNLTPKLTFEAKDATSGIDRYEASIDGGEPFATKSGDPLPQVRPGSHTVVIRAFDKAGNIRESTVTYNTEGIAPPTLISCTKLINLLGAVHLIGRSHPDDTIHVFLDDKEVDKFKAKDKQVPYEKSVSRFKIVAGPPDEIAWEYSYSSLLLPGKHSFRLGRTDTAGAESELTRPCTTEVVASSVKIGNMVLKTSYVMSFLGVIILILLSIIASLLRRVHAAAGKYSGLMASYVIGRVKRLFAKTEQEIIEEIDSTIPNYELSKGSVKDAKKALKEKVHETIEKEEKKVDKLE